MTTHIETVQVRIEHRTAWNTLDRPPLNILDIAMMESLDAALERALPTQQADFLRPLEEAEQIYLSEQVQTQDAQEGIRAFLEKRKPVWKGK